MLFEKFLDHDRLEGEVVEYLERFMHDMPFYWYFLRYQRKIQHLSCLIDNFRSKLSSMISGYALMGMTRRCQIRRISCRNYLYYLTKWLSVVLKRSRSLIPWEPENRWKSIWQKKKFGNPFFNRFKNSLQTRNAKNFTNWAPSRTAGVKKSEKPKIPEENNPRSE